MTSDLALSRSAVTTVDTTVISVEVPEASDPRWSRLPGITVDGKPITIDPAEYFFRFESHTWLVADWELVKSRLPPAQETTESTVEQPALEVYAYLFRDEHPAGLGTPRTTTDHLRVLRQAATLNGVREGLAIGCVIGRTRPTSVGR